MNRDPIAEKGGLNLYGFVRNQPMTSIDHLGKYQMIPPALIPAPIRNDPGFQEGIWSGGMDSDFSQDLDDGIMATTDGLIPFIDPFAKFDCYDPDDPLYKQSQQLGALGRELLMTGGSVSVYRYLASKQPYAISFTERILAVEFGPSWLAWFTSKTPLASHTLFLNWLSKVGFRWDLYMQWVGDEKETDHDIIIDDPNQNDRVLH